MIEKSKQSMSGLPMVVENLKAIKVLVADALQDYCYIENAADGANIISSGFLQVLRLLGH